MLKFKSKKKTFFPKFAIIIWLMTLVIVVLSIYYSDSFSFNNSYAIKPAQIADELNQSWFNITRLVTALFLHGSWKHWAGNMVLFIIIGPPLEKKVGGFWFLMIYLLSGFVANVSSVYQLGDSPYYLLGASGAVSGLLGAWLMLFSNQKISIIIPIGFYLQKAKIPILLLAIIWLSIQVVLQLTSNQDFPIVWSSHIVGFLIGFFVAWVNRFMQG